MNGNPAEAWERERALSELVDRKTALAQTRIDLLDVQLQLAELELRAAQEKLDLARVARLLAGRERELLQLQAVHSHCSLDPQLQGGAGVGALSLLPAGDDWRARWEADMSLQGARLAGAAAELDRDRAALQRRRQQHVAERDGKRKWHQVEQHDRLADLAEEAWRWKKAHRDCTSRVSGEVLPETVLLQVFRLLPLECLAFTAARVCSVWKRVAQDHSLWRDAEFNLDSTSTRKDIALVGMAPLCKSLGLEVEGKGDLYRLLLQRDFHTIVSNLILTSRGSYDSYEYFNGDDHVIKPEASQLFLEFLDRINHHIQRLQIDAKFAWIQEGQNEKFWEIVGTSSLRALRLENVPDHPLSTAFDANLNLEELHVSVSGNISSLGVVAYALCSSRLSLREVSLDAAGPVDCEVIRSLGLCPYLKKVNVPVVKTIGALKGCKEIEELTLSDTNCSGRTEAERGIVELLHSVSSQLTHLEFLNADGRLVGAAHLRMPRLKSLTIDTEYEERMDCSDLLELLQHSPFLERLVLHPWESDEVELLLLTAPRIVVPDLRVLVLNSEFALEDPVASILNILRQQRPGLEIKVME